MKQFVYLLFDFAQRFYHLSDVDTHTFNETNRHRHVLELDNLTPSDKRSYDSTINLIRFLKRYHQACQNSDVRCLCDFKHRSALCYKYDFQYDQYGYCKGFIEEFFWLKSLVFRFKWWFVYLSK